MISSQKSGSTVGHVCDGCTLARYGYEGVEIVIGFLNADTLVRRHRPLRLEANSQAYQTAIFYRKG